MHRTKIFLNLFSIFYASILQLIGSDTDYKSVDEGISSRIM